MASHEGPPSVAALEHQVRSGATAAQIAEAVATTWLLVDGALTPVIGSLGVAALYERSVRLTARSHPWVAQLSLENEPDVVSMTELAAALAERDRGEAALAGGEFLRTFHDLLSSLIGKALTDRLLASCGKLFDESASEPLP